MDRETSFFQELTQLADAIRSSCQREADDDVQVACLCAGVCIDAAVQGQHVSELEDAIWGNAQRPQTGLVGALVAAYRAWQPALDARTAEQLLGLLRTAIAALDTASSERHGPVPPHARPDLLDVAEDAARRFGPSVECSDEAHRACVRATAAHAQALLSHLTCSPADAPLQPAFGCLPQAGMCCYCGNDGGAEAEGLLRVAEAEARALVLLAGAGLPPARAAREEERVRQLYAEMRVCAAERCAACRAACTQGSAAAAVDARPVRDGRAAGAAPAGASLQALRGAERDGRGGVASARASGLASIRAREWAAAAARLSSALHAAEAGRRAELQRRAAGGRGRVRLLEVTAGETLARRSIAAAAAEAWQAASGFRARGGGGGPSAEVAGVVVGAAAAGREAVAVEQAAARRLLGGGFDAGRRLLSALLIQRAFRRCLASTTTRTRRTEEADSSDAAGVVERRAHRVFNVVCVQAFLKARISRLLARRQEARRLFHSARVIQCSQRRCVARETVSSRLRLRRYAHLQVCANEEHSAQRIQWVWRRHKAVSVSREAQFAARLARYHAFCATLMQSRWRGVTGRRQTAFLRCARLESAAVVCQGFCRAKLSARRAFAHGASAVLAAFLRARLSRSVRTLLVQTRCARRIQRAVRASQSRRRVADRKAIRCEQNQQRIEHHEAAAIQRLVRGWLTRTRVADKRAAIQRDEEVRMAAVKRAAILALQKVGRALSNRRRLGVSYGTARAAAVVIQCAARRHVARVVVLSKARVEYIRDVSVERIYAAYVLQAAGRAMHGRCIVSALLAKLTAEVQERRRVEEVIKKVVFAGWCRMRLYATRCRVQSKAVTIQCAYRLHVARCARDEQAAVRCGQRREEMKIYSAIIIQDAWRAHARREHAAALRIQGVFLRSLRCSLRDATWGVGKSRRRRRYKSPQTVNDAWVEVRTETLSAEAASFAQLCRCFNDTHPLLLPVMSVMRHIPLTVKLTRCILSDEAKSRSAVEGEYIYLVMSEVPLFKQRAAVLAEQALRHNVMCLNRTAALEKRRIVLQYTSEVRQINLRIKRLWTHKRRKAVARLVEKESTMRNKMLVEEYSQEDGLAAYDRAVEQRLSADGGRASNRHSSHEIVGGTVTPGARDHLPSGAAHRLLNRYLEKDTTGLQSVFPRIVGGWDDRIRYADVLKKIDESNAEYDRTNGLYGTDGELYVYQDECSAAPATPAHDVTTSRECGHIAQVRKRRVSGTSFAALCAAIAGDFVTKKRMESIGGSLSYIPNSAGKRNMCSYRPPLPNASEEPAARGRESIKTLAKQPLRPRAVMDDTLDEERRVTDSLAILDLSEVALTPGMACDIFLAMQNNTSIGVLKMESCDVTDAAGPAAAECLQHNTTLASLSLCGNPGIGNAFVECLLGVLSRNHAIRTLDLHGTSVSPAKRLEVTASIPPVFSSPALSWAANTLPPLKASTPSPRPVDVASTYSGVVAMPQISGKPAAVEAWLTNGPTRKASV